MKDYYRRMLAYIAGILYTGFKTGRIVDTSKSSGSVTGRVNFAAINVVDYPSKHSLDGVARDINDYQLYDIVDKTFVSFWWHLNEFSGSDSSGGFIKGEIKESPMEIQINIREEDNDHSFYTYFFKPDKVQETDSVSNLGCLIILGIIFVIIYFLTNK